MARPDAPPFHLVEPPPEYDDEPPPAYTSNGRAPAPRDSDPPQDIAAEQAVLGSLILKPDLADELAHEISRDDFYQPRHQTIWDAAHHLLQQGAPLEETALVAHLTNTGELRTVGGALYVHELVEQTLTPASASYYARLVRERARLRALDETATRLRQIARSPNSLDNLDQALGDALQAVEDAATRYGPTERTATSWAAVDLTDVLAGGELDPPPALLVRNDGRLMLYAGAVHTISGEPTSGKTWAALLAAVQQLHAGHTVAMLDFEDRASRVTGRLLGLGARPEAIRERFRYVRPNAGLADSPQAKEEALAACAGTTLVIIDGVTEVMALHGWDPNSNPDVAAFYKAIPRWLADTTGAAVVMIDHVVKDTEKQGRWGIGAQHKLAGLDGVSYLVKNVEPFGRGKVGHSRITIGKDRPGFIEEYALGRSAAELWLDARDVNVLRCDLKAPTAVTTDEAGAMRPTYLMERVSRWLEMHAGSTTKEVKNAGLGRTQYVLRSLDSLIREGYIEVSDGPRGAKFHRIETPYREDEDA